MVGSAQEMVYRFGSFTLDLGRGALAGSGDKERPLRPKSFAVLRFLVENAGRLMSRNAIMEAVWPDIYVTDDNITQCIHDIRHALNGESDKLLRTVQRRGYVFTADVAVEPRLLPGTAFIQPHGDPADDAGEPTGRAGISGEEARREPELRSSGVVRENHASSLAPLWRPSSRRPSRLSVLVTLLRDVGVAEKNKYLTEVISEDIATDLSQFPEMFVVGHAEAFLRSGDACSAGTIAREYGLNYIVQGSMRGSADQIGVNAQLIDAGTGVHLWAERFDIESASAPDASNEMTGRLVCALSLQLLQDANRRIEAVRPEEWSPYDLMIHGRALMVQPFAAANRQEAVRCFEQALLDDPDLIDAKIRIAFVLLANVADGWSTSIDHDRARAEQLLLDVLSVDADRPLGHLLMGMLRRLEGRFEDAKIELGIAVKLSPNNAGALCQLGQALAFSGDPEAAIPHIERSLRLAPHDSGTPVYYSCLGMCQLLLGRTEEAIICLKKARAGNPGLFYIHLHLAAALGLRGELEEAGVALRRAAEIKPGLLRRSGVIGLLRRPNPAFSALWLKTADVGLRRAGMHAD